MKYWILCAALAAAGCGITQQQLDERIGKERRWSEQERRAFTDSLTARFDQLEQSLQATMGKLEQSVAAMDRNTQALALRVKHVEGDLATIKAVADALTMMQKDSKDRLAEMKRLHEQFNANVDSLDQKIRVSQEKYRDIIRKNIQSLKEQYSYFSNLLRELEAGNGGGRAGGGDKDG